MANGRYNTPVVVIIEDCGSNFSSVQFALSRIGVASLITNDVHAIRAATHIILPGVGHAKYAMDKLNKTGLDKIIKTLTQPVLGICLGMQLLYEASEEGDTECLGIIPGTIKRLQTEDTQIIPHMGWNTINFLDPKQKLCKSLPDKKHVYFVHSYAAPVNEFSVATTDYTQEFTAIVQYKNIFGMQFHPEKSGKLGETLLKNFIYGKKHEITINNYSSYRSI